MPALASQGAQKCGAEVIMWSLTKLMLVVICKKIRKTLQQSKALRNIGRTSSLRLSDYYCCYKYWYSHTTLSPCQYFGNFSVSNTSCHYFTEGALAICTCLTICEKTPYLCTIDPQNLAEALGKLFFIELWNGFSRFAFTWHVIPCWKIRVCIFTSFEVVIVKKDFIELFKKVRYDKGQGGLALDYFLGVFF